MSELFHSNAEAQARCAEWQRLLLLQDWEIVVQIVRERDMSCGGKAAEVVYSRDKKLARIALVDSADYYNATWPLDHEKSLVHELLHLHLAFSDPLVDENQDAKRELEIAVDSLARAFVRLKRNSEKYFAN